METQNTNPTANEGSNSNTLKTQVENFRDEARNKLRMVEINKILTDILVIKNSIKEHEKYLEKIDMGLAILEYENKKLDPEHPDYKGMKERKENAIKVTKEDVKNAHEQKEKTIELLKLDIEDLETEIKNWESGTKKVDKYKLEDITNSLIN